MSSIREHWGSRLGFILAAAGSAIGLGSLWRFPYVAGQNGGGAFVLLYIIFTFFIGVPVFIGAIIIGRRSQKSAVSAYGELCPKHHKWNIIGWINVLTTFIILSYYSVVSGWCLNYALMSVNQFAVNKSPEEIKNIFETLFASPGINVFWLVIFVLLNIGVLIGGVRKGIERWSRILMPGLFFILIVLFFYSMTMDGFPKAVAFIFKPNFVKLTPSVILNALGMAFFTLSIGLGILVTYGSYMKSSEDIPKTGIIVAIMSLTVSILAALMIYPIVFSFN
ncbi:MAG: sodium-dependent transporter, partial [Simkaniaceae bacterium]|nr:sodium-dependent transporter [Simkaniaceae bacterium]